MWFVGSVKKKSVRYRFVIHSAILVVDEKLEVFGGGRMKDDKEGGTKGRSRTK